ncbi:carbohydrate kinase [Longimycelium tulufanense]|uniref:Carbohydrate kinase n=1 Tax=Longimycelium tulufanense TaxID=907463 RepID=A0A8J3CE56_9PSEU|nr:FGGY-family carbohydrate kinase [Longimycelium tulufanense]GGM80407.1 carbohydrate kinase [Longimycelium tulufanense]
MSVLAVDLGTSMIKTVVFDDDGTEVAVRRLATEVHRARPGWAEQDMAAVWAAVTNTVRAAVAEVGDEVRLLALTGQGDGCWLVDSAGRPTGPAILWSDGRAGPIVERWRREGVLAEAFRRNGSLTFPGLANAILRWLAEHDPDRLGRSAAALTCDGWVFSRLTGQLVIDESDASAPFLDLGTRRYSPELQALFGMEWAGRLLPEVRRNGDRIGALTTEAAAELGLPAGLPVVMAPYDVASAALGVGAVSPGQACTILGTTLATEVVRDAVDTSGEPAGLTIALDTPGHVLRAYPTLAGTEVIRWAMGMLGLQAPDQLGALAEQSPPGAHGLMFLPYLSPAGERAPFLDPKARGTLWGLTIEHSRSDVARAVFEGLSLVIRDCLLAAGAAGELRVCGGGSVSATWCQVIADITGLPTLRSTDSEVGAKGAFLTGMVAIGAEPDLAAAAARYVRVHHAYEPDPERNRQYVQQYEDFLALRELARKGWQRLAGRTAPVPAESALRLGGRPSCLSV